MGDVIGWQMVHALDRIVEALRVISGNLTGVASGVAGAGSAIREQLEAIHERYELLTDAQAGPIKRERDQAERREEEARFAEEAEQVRKGETTNVDGEEVPSAPEEREAWLTAGAARVRETLDQHSGPLEPPAGS